MSLADQPVHPSNVLNEVSGNIVDQNFGITLLEHYAGQVMASMVASISTDDCYQRMRRHADAEEPGMRVSQWIAKQALKQAEEMIKALEERAAQLANRGNRYDFTVQLLRRVAEAEGVPTELQRECAAHAENMEIPF